MRGYDKLLELYTKASCEKPDKQFITFLCGKKVSAPIERVLAQFKYCVLHKELGDSYSVLKLYLQRFFPDEVIDTLEKMEQC